MQELKQYIDQWVKSLSVKRPEIGNFPICPFSGKAKYHLISSTFYGGVREALDKIGEYDIIIINLEEHYTPDELEKEVDLYNNNLRHDDIYIFYDHPDQLENINGVVTNNKKYTLLLIQKLSDLNKASDSLKKTNYYSYWTKQYYDKIVTKREV